MNIGTDKSASIAFRSAAWLVAFLSLWVVLDFGQPILMPFVMAVFTSILIFPILAWLVNHRMPGAIAIVAAQLVGFMPIVAFIFVFLLTVGPVQRSLPTYQKHITKLTYTMADELIDWLEKFDISEATREQPPRPEGDAGSDGLPDGEKDEEPLENGGDPVAPDEPATTLPGDSGTKGDSGPGTDESGDPAEDGTTGDDGGTALPMDPTAFDEPGNESRIIEEVESSVPPSDREGEDGTETATRERPKAPEIDNRETLRMELKGRVLPRLVTEGVVFAQSLLGTTTALVTNLFLVVLMTTFILIEGRRFGEKFEEAYGKDNAIMVSLGSIAQEVRTYVVAKTLISALTGLVVWIFLSIMEIESAGFWGLASFALNYIPNIGSIAASVPPILIALVNYYVLDFGEWYAPWITAIGLMAIQTVIGSFMDPRLVGASLKLSPFVIVMSMLTWGLLWGPFGMILSVPIMVS